MRGLRSRNQIYGLRNSLAHVTGDSEIFEKEAHAAYILPYL